MFVTPDNCFSFLCSILYNLISTKINIINGAKVKKNIPYNNKEFIVLSPSNKVLLT